MLKSGIAAAASARRERRKGRREDSHVPVRVTTVTVQLTSLLTERASHPLAVITPTVQLGGRPQLMQGMGQRDRDRIQRAGWQEKSHEHSTRFGREVLRKLRESVGGGNGWEIRATTVPGILLVNVRHTEEAEIVT